MNPWRMGKLYRLSILIALGGVVDAIIARDIVSLFMGLGILCLLLVTVHAPWH